MIPRLYAEHYSRNYKIALICSLAFVLILFTLLPELQINQKSGNKVYTVFTLQDVPPTVQSAQNQQAAATIPKTPAVPIASDITEPEILSDVQISNSSSTQNVNSTGTGIAKNGAVQANTLPFIPRQIKEVLPQKPEKDIKGYIKLSLKIDKSGKVENYILLVNSTKSSECLKNVLRAAYLSRWQPAKVNGFAVEYWIDKVYNFQ